MRSILALLLALVPGSAIASLPARTCVLTESCVVGQPCVETVAEFQLDPILGGYATAIDAGRVKVMQVSPPEAAMQSFMLSGPQSITVLLSIYPDGAVALTVHEDIGGRYVETAYGRCVEDR